MFLQEKKYLLDVKIRHSLVDGRGQFNWMILRVLHNSKIEIACFFIKYPCNEIKSFRLTKIYLEKKNKIILGHEKERKNKYGEYREVTTKMHSRRNTLNAIQQAISRSFHIVGAFSPKFYTFPFFF
mgnify:CR=1